MRAYKVTTQGAEDVGMKVQSTGRVARIDEMKLIGTMMRHDAAEYAIKPTPRRYPCNDGWRFHRVIHDGAEYISVNDE